MNLANEDFCRGLRHAMKVIETHIQAFVQKDIEEHSEYYQATCFNLWQIKRELADVERRTTEALHADAKVKDKSWTIYRDTTFIGNVWAVDQENDTKTYIVDSSNMHFTTLREAMEYLDTPPSARGFRWPKGE